MRQARYYCTLFDSGYLSRGLALYNSLMETSSVPAFLYILAMDEDCYRILNKLKLKNVTVIHLEKEFLDDRLTLAKSNRSWTEFCWTCSSGLIKYLFDRAKLDQVTYLDSDIYFFQDPEKIFVEFSEQNSALITDHFYFSRHDQSANSGRFCVQFVPFNRNSEGQTVLNRWYEQCLEDCSFRPEKGVCGDQKYLDEWPILYPRVKISTNPGAGVAPWNVEKYRFFGSNSVSLNDHGKIWPLIFYHFHGLKFFDSNRVELSGDRYHINRFVYDHVYLPYFKALKSAALEVSRVNETVSHGIKKDILVPKSLLKRALKNLIATLKNNVNASVIFKDLSTSE